MTHRSQRRQTSRGMTLIELLVSLGIGLVILAVLYVLFSQTVDISDRQLAEAQALQEASQLSERIRGLIDSSAHPESLVNEAPNLASEQFLPDNLTIYALSNVSGEGPRLFQVSNNIEETSRTIKISGDPIRPHQDLFDSSIKFEYASEFNNQLEPMSLADSVTARPKYIRYTITIRDKRKMMRKDLTITSGAALK